MPVLGLGVADLSEDEAERAVLAALEIGCRLIDTAAAYGNEAAVGRAIAASGIPRAELFVTTKLATPDQGFTKSQDACNASLDRLGMDYVDLYLIHWPAPPVGQYVDAWGGMIQSRGEGHARSIGVCNFTEEHLSAVIDLTFVTPAVNQIELHPLLNQDEMRKSNAQHNVVTQSYTPLVLGRLMDNPTLTSIAAEYGKTPAQVLLRWNLQLGNAVVFRSANAEHIASNLDVFDFELAVDHMDTMNGLHDGTRLRPDPETYTGS
ncbi:2,5-diketo-D-gluconic acid reductase [Mycobacterium haemophilum DSM 44634]|uniref:2,5-diketo-D-gluconic acid reductase n=2 Tax=Mycobacterium haemophilum TaxID=29311 RepID=A0A0I9UDD3_9MYCO|nr:2,5-diketo-D-gluconic acid reductase [Mycobacterium haemophilum DSM 44634]KLO33697.1 2,5-diketo-D-gluconic acid reductase [Mycobacterium haemophilum]KLO39225.1 2,5-diketo-D-gluconic acid reductase [Mycobacterium haemophilum]KLO45531.1 2,5-diketo-D-gluconic acid reductase [Mycobacterium haemophilum]KLO56681.1 2,5-diketo-D-gluconic acid reductase [Mycobacterium haemophilum]